MELCYNCGPTGAKQQNSFPLQCLSSVLCWQSLTSFYLPTEKYLKGSDFVFTGEAKWRIWSWELIKSYTCFSLTLHRGWSLERTAGATNLRSAQHGAHMLLTPWTTSWISLPPWIGSNGSTQKASFFSPRYSLCLSRLLKVFSSKERGRDDAF